MARSRNIKPGFFVNDELAECPPLARLMFIGLWTLADAEGRLKDKPRQIKAQTLPYDNCDPDSLLINLEQSGFIQRYVVLGQPTIQVVNFVTHQNPHINERKKGSVFGSFDDRDNETEEKQEVKEESSKIQINPDKSDTNRDDSLLLNDEPLIPDPDSLKNKGEKLTLGIKVMRAMRPHDVDKQLWDEYLQLRARKKAEKTDRAMKAIIKSLVDCMENGVSRQSMIEMCVEQGWKGVNYEWYKNKKGEDGGTSGKEFEGKDYQAGAQTKLPPGWE